MSDSRPVESACKHIDRVIAAFHGLWFPPDSLAKPDILARVAWGPAAAGETSYFPDSHEDGLLQYDGDYYELGVGLVDDEHFALQVKLKLQQPLKFDSSLVWQLSISVAAGVRLVLDESDEHGRLVARELSTEINIEKKDADDRVGRELFRALCNLRHSREAISGDGEQEEGGAA